MQFWVQKVTSISSYFQVVDGLLILGSGKKALLDVISRRVHGPTRGQILLNNQPMSLSLFQQRCGYVTHKCDLIPGLTVEQTLYYTPTKVLKILSTISW